MINKFGTAYAGQIDFPDRGQDATPANERRFGKETTARRHRLAEVERELVGLRYRHDIAMSAFRFDEAIALGPAIAALEQERQALAAALPASTPEAGIVPVLRQPRRRGRRG